VGIFFFLGCVTAAVGRIHQFAGQTLDHRFFAAFAGAIDDPAHCQSTGTVKADFNRNLIRCTTKSFEAAVFEPTLRAELGILGPSVEGFLFPATYELSVDTEPRALIRQLVGETRKRLARLSAEYPGAVADLSQKDGFGEHEIVTLASIIERESGHAKEDAVIAGVFFNRLRDPDFRPARSLQSDPTAAYGCLVAPDSAPSCAAYRGQVLPTMLRDAQNRYNTYRHPGLPPGPISNPGESALRAVLAPNKSDYLYFVAAGGGRHRFSRTFEEHRQAVTGGR
jgi:uncharacterized YceG family protein